MDLMKVSLGALDGGMNKADAAHLIEDNQASYLQDFISPVPGLLRMRGPLVSAQNAIGNPVANLPSQSPVGVVGCRNVVNGSYNVFIPLPSSSSVVLSSPYTSYSSVSFGPAVNSDSVVIGQTGLQRGVFVVEVENPLSSHGSLYYWLGATKNTYSTGTITATRGSTSVTGTGTSFLSSVEPGMAIFAYSNDDTSNKHYIGIVSSVSSDTALTLEKGSLHNATAKGYEAVSMWQRLKMVAKGRIDCASTSSTVTGRRTKFRKLGMNSGVWFLYRATDMAYIGKVSSVTDDDTITLTANAAVDMSNERFIALSSGYNNSFPGYLTCSYASRQWYFQADRGYFSEIDLQDAVDTTELDGDYLNLPNFGNENSSWVLGVFPHDAGILVFKEHEVGLIQGNSRETFRYVQFFGDGLLSPATIQSYESGVIWAGRRGIYYFDGTVVHDLTKDQLGSWFVATYKNFDVNTYRAWSIIHKDHLFFHEESNGYSLCINLRTGFTSFLSNVRFMGGVVHPSFTQLNPWFIVLTAGGAAALCDANSLIVDSGTDSIVCNDDNAGPRPVFISKAFTAGEEHAQKWWKELIMTYRAEGTGLSVQTEQVLPTDPDDTSGFLTPGTTPSSFSTSTGFTKKRAKFHRRSHFLRFKLESSTPGAATLLEIASAEMLFKIQRRERF